MRAALVLLALVAAGLWWAQGRQSRPDSLAWQAVDRDLAARYPAVPTITTGALAAWLADTSRTPPLLLDARQAEEYAVSHLPGARRVDPEAGPAALAAAVGEAGGRPVVVYCSVGVRSAGVASRLREAGVTRVANLEGSIFRWANEGRPVVRGGQPVREVHPYDAVWGRLLRPGLRAEAD